MSEQDHNKYTGSVSVEGDTTPITREKVNKVDSLRWEDMSTSELIEQQSTLQSRLTQAYSLGHPQLVQQLEQGLAHINEILKSRPGGSNSSTGIT